MPIAIQPLTPMPDSPGISDDNQKEATGFGSGRSAGRARRGGPGSPDVGRSRPRHEPKVQTKRRPPCAASSIVAPDGAWHPAATQPERQPPAASNGEIIVCPGEQGQGKNKTECEVDTDAHPPAVRPSPAFSSGTFDAADGDPESEGEQKLRKRTRRMIERMRKTKIL